MKTTKRHFEIFEKECRKWIDRFELNNWEIIFVHSKDASNRAWITPSNEGMNVKICLGSEWYNLEPDVITNVMIKRSAFHEVCELLIEPVCWLGECRYLTDTEMGPARHILIGKLEHVLFKMEK